VPFCFDLYSSGLVDLDMYGSVLCNLFVPMDTKQWYLVSKIQYNFFWMNLMYFFLSTILLVFFFLTSFIKEICGFVSLW
jgi:hypothetical protein